MYLVNKDQKDVFDAAKRNALNIWACIYVYMQKSISTTDMPEYSPKKRDKMSRVSLLFSRQGTENLCNYKTVNTINRSSPFSCNHVGACDFLQLFFLLSFLFFSGFLKCLFSAVPLLGDEKCSS